VKRLIGICALFVSVAPFGHTETIGDHLMSACQADLEQYCSQVTPGSNRLLHCAAAHQDKLSGQCEYALYQAAQQLEEMAAAIAYFAQACETELTTVCADVEVGTGRVLSCLNANPDKVSDGCKKAIADTVEQ
jgi:hypothetical protein